MATAPTLPLVSVDEYLNSSYEPDMEFVDGVLIPRGMPTIAHSLLQKLLLFWFADFEDELSFEAMQEFARRLSSGRATGSRILCFVRGRFPRGVCVTLCLWSVIEVQCTKRFR